MTESRTDGAVRGYHEWHGDGSLATSIVRAVAAAREEAPSQIEPISETVDTEALEALFAPRSDGTRRDTGSVSFTFDGCEVRVHADGEIVVFPPE